MNNVKFISFVFTIFILVLNGCGISQETQSFLSNDNYITKPQIVETQNTKNNENSDSGEKNDNKQSQNLSNNQELPTSVNLEMVFVSQAPFANWDDLHDEACEEASILLVHDYLSDIKSISKEEADQEIVKMVAWQVKNYGGHYDLTAEKTAKFIKEYHGYENVKVYHDISIDDIKSQLANGNPVIVPAAGRQLGNPYFREPGPIYHMLVIKGYTLKDFITNDVGTRRGENYHYDQNVLYNAIHDFVDKSEEGMDRGRKAMIIIK